MKKSALEIENKRKRSLMNQAMNNYIVGNTMLVNGIDCKIIDILWDYDVDGPVVIVETPSQRFEGHNIWNRITA